MKQPFTMSGRPDTATTAPCTPSMTGSTPGPGARPGQHAGRGLRHHLQPAGQPEVAGGAFLLLVVTTQMLRPTTLMVGIYMFLSLHLIDTVWALILVNAGFNMTSGWNRSSASTRWTDTDHRPGGLAVRVGTLIRLGLHRLDTHSALTQYHHVQSSRHFEYSSRRRLTAAARTAFPVWFRCRAPRAVVLSCAVASVILIGVLPMSAAPAAAAQVAAPRNTVTFIGDSVTAGFGYCGPALASAAARTRRWPTRGTSARTT